MKSYIVYVQLTAKVGWELIAKTEMIEAETAQDAVNQLFEKYESQYEVANIGVFEMVFVKPEKDKWQKSEN